MDRGGAVGDCAAAGVAGVFAGSVVLSRFAAGLRHRALKDAGVFRTVLGRVLIKSRLATAKCQCALWSTWKDRKSTRLNSSHLGISYAVFCLKKKMTRP